MAQSKASRGGTPRIWLMTDPRLDGALLASARALPRGSAIVLRHYELKQSERRALFLSLRRIARQRGHRLYLAGDAMTARRWGADGVHGRAKGSGTERGLQCSAPVHDRAELLAAARCGADYALISPVYPTRSHPGAKALGASGFRKLAMLARTRGLAPIALGGMTRARFAMLRALPVGGWAAIDALKKNSGRKAPEIRSESETRQKRIKVPR